MLNTSSHLHLDDAKKVGASLVADVFLATKKNTDEKFLVKKIRPEFVLDGVIDHLHQQLNHLKRLDIPELLIPQLQLDENHNLQLIQTYPEGQLLRTWLTEQTQIKIRTVLEIGIALADCVAARHRAALIHKAIKPNNILIQENPIRIQLVDELQVVDTAQLSQFVNNNHYLRETLPYVAPEITGQVRTRIDYYSDLYSLGTVLYECVTGRPPFISDDPQSLIHSHLAEEPTPASEHCAQCPAILSEIIATLLHKQPEKRYQSAIGLRADLQACLSTLEESEVTTGKPVIPAFQLRQREISYQISIPSIMVGRDFEQQQLLDEYQRVCTGKLGVVMVAGVSGIGKTRLIQELELPIVAKQGYFTCGKFNQFSSHLPYSTLSSALSRLVRQILTEDSTRIAYWRERIQSVLGNSGRLITDIVPDLEILVGQQAELPLLSAMDARVRFNDVFSRFLACIASRNHPLVLFIDDMQWCDPATFDFLELIFSAPESYPYLLIIGAYRSNEVDSHHRVHQLELVADQSTLPLVTLQLNPLGRADVNRMVAYILNTSPFRTEGLAATIESVVGGSPLYVSEGLRWLHDNELLSLSDDGTWAWEDDAFVGVGIPESAGTLFEEKLKKCSSNVRELLAIGALLG
ncbi:MAG: AAA family ATPase, partial [Gammaproteobacteria bacterium]|nr:AAA family ATPase [Gammaproteobacteria bacterium]